MYSLYWCVAILYLFSIKEVTPAVGVDESDKSDKFPRVWGDEWFTCPPNSWIQGFDIFLHDYKWPLYFNEDTESEEFDEELWDHIKDYGPSATRGHDTLGVTRLIFICRDRHGNQQGM